MGTMTAVTVGGERTTTPADERNNVAAAAVPNLLLRPFCIAVRYEFGTSRRIVRRVEPGATTISTWSAEGTPSSAAKTLAMLASVAAVKSLTSPAASRPIWIFCT